MNTKIKWAIWSGEGEVGSKKIKTATLQGIKRILTQERCGGDRFAHACPAHWPEAQFCSSARECDIDNLTEADIERMHAGQALGSIRTPKKAASSRENGKKGGRPKTEVFEMNWETNGFKAWKTKKGVVVEIWNINQGMHTGRKALLAGKTTLPTENDWQTYLYAAKYPESSITLKNGHKVQ